MIMSIGNDWDDLLKEEFQQQYFKDLMEFLDIEYRRFDIFPPRSDIFNALKYTSYKDTKVVIVGQDPYINEGQAHGLAFSVQPEAKIPPSLYNIFKELRDDLGCYIPDNGCLIPWAQQGVLLLNTSLTVRSGSSGSHSAVNIGWSRFTNKILELLNQKDESLIFMLWGNYAKSKADMLDPNSHMILKASHPSPLAGGAFFGCKHFSKANEYLYEITPHTIEWQIPNTQKEENINV